jgi:hypothetical protein
MHDPRLSPCSVRHDEVRSALCERRPELAAHELGQGLERDQVTVVCRVPMAAVVGDAAAGDQAVDMDCGPGAIIDA